MNLAVKRHQPREAIWWIVYDRDADLIVSRHKSQRVADAALHRCLWRQARGRKLRVRIKQDEWSW